MEDNNMAISVIEARLIAVKAHGDQKDRDGSFHINHVFRVADNVAPEASYQVVAYLHDVLEDTNYNLEDEAIDDYEWEALQLLTRTPESGTYVEYIQGIADASGRAGALARGVKRADVRDNLIRSLRNEKSEFKAINRYGRALSILSETRHFEPNRDLAPLSY